jgi:hypothetical protein
MNLPLTADSRGAMLDELQQDVAETRIYQSPRLTELGQADLPRLLEAAACEHDDQWLADQLRVVGRLNEQEVSHRNGRQYTKAVPHSAAETLAEGEFNRLFIRGQCRLAGERGVANLVVFRAKSVAAPRLESERRIGASIGAAALLDDLRNHVGIETALGVPGGPNSGLSARLQH